MTGRHAAPVLHDPGTSTNVGPARVVVNVAAHILDHASFLIIRVSDDCALAFAAPRIARQRPVRLCPYLDLSMRPA
jgi:hypothetical protein